MCGHKHRVSDDRLGKKIKCMACDEVFRLSPSKAISESPPQPAKDADEPLGRRLVKKALGDPSAALDGCIPGAIGGVLAGMVVPVFAGIFTSEEGGGIIGKAFLGFLIGFGIGVVVGAVWGAGGRRFVPGFQVKPGRALLGAGAVIGTIVAVIAEHDWRWIPLGAIVGAAGAYLWVVVCNRVEAAMNAPGPMSAEEDDLFEAD
jgi:hypothetical protein